MDSKLKRTLVETVNATQQDTEELWETLAPKKDICISFHNNIVMDRQHRTPLLSFHIV